MPKRRVAAVLGACLLFLLAAGSFTPASAQNAVRIDRIDPPIAKPGDIVTLRGAGLNTPYLFVLFGGVYAPPLSVSATAMTVRVPQTLPSGITYVLLTWLFFPIDFDLFAVLPITNAPPSVNAGPDQTITLPDVATLSGSATDDGLPSGSTLAVSWQKVSGPGTVTFGAPTSASTTASFSTDGPYVLRLTASDSVLQTSDDVNVTVNPAAAPTIGVSPSSFSFTATAGGANPSAQTLDVTNIGSGTLDVQVTDDASWLTVTPDSGTAPAVFSVASDITGLTANTYTGSVIVAGTGATNTPVVIQVTLTVDPPPTPTIGVSPAGFSFSGIEGGANPAPQTLDISNTGAGTLNFQISDDAAWLTVTPDAGIAPAGLAVSTDITGLLENTYTATITVNGTGATNTPVLIPVTLTIGEPPKPQVSIADQTIVEGDTGSAEIQFAVTLSHTSPRTVTVNFTTEDGSAHAGPDYATASGPVVFTPGLTTQFVSVAVNGDRLNEIDETFAVNLSGPVNATIGDAQAIGTIQNDDPLPALRISDASAVEGDTGSTPLSFTVEMVDAGGQIITSGRTVTVNFNTASGAGMSGATSGQDFGPASGMLTFLEGESAKQIPVSVVGDLNVESDETFDVVLSAPVNATISDATGVGTIANDDVPTIDVSPATLHFTGVAGGSNPSSQTFHIANTGTGLLSFTVADDAPWLSLDIPSGNAPADVEASVTIGGLASGTYNASIGITSAGATNTPQFVAVTLVVDPANQAPHVNAGEDQAITLPASAHLSGTVTDDGLPVGATVTAQWAKVSGPGSVTFTNATSPATDASFSEAGTYVLSLTASDTALTGGDDVTIDVIAANRAPLANAGPDASVHVTETAHLDGSGSSDPDGDPLTYAWTFMSRPDGSAATLSDPASIAPTFLVDRPGSYVVQLVVNDGALDSEPDTVTITTENSAPVANAGADQTATVTSTVTLNGSASSDVDGDALTYTWSFASVPSGSNVTLSDPAAVSPTFVVDATGTYDLQLVVNDGVTDSVADHMIVSTINSAPVANAGTDQSVFVTQTVTLNGSGSSDVDGDALTYLWQITSAPAGSAAALNDPTAVMPTFIVDLPGTYVIALVVSDSFVPSAADTVTITTENSAPVASAGAAQTAFVGDTVTLDGSGSTDVDGDTLTYAWSFTSVPPGSSAVLSDPGAVRPTFVVDRPGTYVVQLIVHDGAVASAPATTMLSTLNSAPVANPGPDRTVIVGRLVFLDGTGSSDVDGDPLTYQWSIITSPAGSTASLTGATTAGPSFTVDRLGTFIVQLIVNDGHVNSAPRTVTIDTTNTLPVARAGADQLNVPIGVAVSLDGSTSSDDDGHSLTYFWSLTTKPAGSTATISDPAAIAPTFTPDLYGDHVVQLIVNDGFMNSSPDTLLVHANGPPLADAGDDQSVATGAIVPLDGTPSADPEGEPLTYLWEFTSLPGGSAAVFDDPASATPTFVADVDGTYIIQLTVTDVAGAVASDSVTVTATPVSLPVVSVIASDASASETGPDGGVFTFVRTGSTSASLLVHYTVGGTATGGSDYTPALTGDLLIPSGQASETLSITPVDDSETEGPETVTVTVEPTAAYTLGPQVSATITIADSDEPPITLALVDTSAVGVALTSTLEITLGQPAPPGGVSVTVTSENPGVLSVVPPSTVTIAAGASTGQVQVLGASAGTTFVHAHAAAGYADGTLEVNVTVNIISTPLTLNVPLAQSNNLPVSLTRDATNTGPVVVNLTSNNPAVVSVSTPVVNFAAGQTLANAVVFGQGSGQATITVSATGFATDTTIATTTANLDITASSVTINSAFGANLTIELESPPGSPVAAPTGGVAVAIGAGNPACVNVPAATVIAQGTTSALAAISYGGSATLPCTTTVSATGPVGVTGDSVTVTVNQAPGINLGVIGSIGGGLQVFANGTLGTGNHGGVTVHLVSSDPSRVMLAPNATTAGTASIDLTLINGTTSFSYFMQAADWIDGSSAAGPVTITASAQAFNNGSAAANYMKPSFDMTGLSASYPALAGNDAFVVRVGIPNGANVNAQDRRFGGSPISVLVTNSNAAAAEIDINPVAAGAQSQTVTIVAGQSSTLTGGPGTPEFDPISPGSTTVTASITGFNATSTATQTITVTGTGITIPAWGQVGGGLQKFESLTLGAGNHGGVNVHLVSNDSRVLLAATATTIGADSIDVFVPNTSTSVGFYVQGADWVDGVSVPATATITVSAPGFTTASGTVGFAEPAVDVSGLVTATTTLSGNDDFVARVGLPNTPHSSLAETQVRRFGGNPLVVTITNSNALVARLDQDGGVNGAQSQTVQIVAGQSSSTANGPGSIEFHPISPGTTSVTASIPNFTNVGTSTANVTVTGPGISIAAFSPIGGGLQFAAQGTLGAPNHGGVDVHITSGDTSRVLIAANASSAGAASIDVHVANGSTLFTYYLQATDWIDGTSSTAAVTITASAPGFSDGSRAVDYVKPAVQIVNLSATTNSLSPNDLFNVRVGIPSAGNASVNVAEGRRFGAPPLVVTVTNSNASVAEIDLGGLGSQSQTASISTPSFDTPTGLEFDPIGSGPTTVSASIPNFISTTAANVTVTVNTPAITLSTPGTVAGGLQTIAVNGSLGGGSATQHGDMTVHLVSSDPTRLILAPNVTTPGNPDGTLDVPVAAGVASFFYVIQALDWVEGVSTPTSVSITASATGFTNGTATVPYVQPAVTLIVLVTSISRTAANDDFQVQVGVPNALNTALAAAQARRAGATAIPVTVTNSNGTVAEIDQNGGLNGAQSQDAQIVAGQNATPNNAAGGLEFDPLTAGSTTVSASATGFIRVTTATQNVTVTP